MAGLIEVRERDLRRLLDIVDPSRAGAPGGDVPYSFLHDIADLVPCDHVGFHVQDLSARWARGQGTAPGDDEVLDGEKRELWWPAFWEACSYPQRSGDYTTVTRESDHLPGVADGPHWATFAEACGRRGPEYGMILSLPPAGTVDRRLLLWRKSGPDFNDRDVMLLTLLRPHIIALHQRHHALQAGTPDLTQRQREILHLVATGLTNRQIARALAVSEATVRTHLENIYTRLDVGNRTGALAIWTDGMNGHAPARRSGGRGVRAWGFEPTKTPESVKRQLKPNRQPPSGARRTADLLQHRECVLARGIRRRQRRGVRSSGMSAGCQDATETE